MFLIGIPNGIPHRIVSRLQSGCTLGVNFFASMITQGTRNLSE